MKKRVSTQIFLTMLIIPGVLCISLIDLLSNESLVQKHHECIVVSNQELDDDEMSIDEFYDFGNNSFELRLMSISTHMNRNNTKWDGKMAFRHDGSHQSSWWISSRMIKHSLEVDFE